MGRQFGKLQIADGRPWSPEIQLEQETFGLVAGLFDRPQPKGDVLELVRKHKGISDEVRRQALELAERLWDEPARYCQTCRAVVCHRDAGPDLFRKPLGWAHTACRLAPMTGRAGPLWAWRTIALASTRRH
jgi:hypothetical protein